MPSGTLTPAYWPRTAGSLPIRSLLTCSAPSLPFWKAACVRASIWPGVSRNPPCRAISSISASKISATAKTCFSPMQSRLLSNAPPATIERAAFSRQAVASTTTGGLPGPATIARLLLASAARATAGPPVTTRSRTPRCSNRSLADSSVGGSMIVSRLSSPIASRIALLNRRTPSAAIRAPEGWALKTTVLPAASMLIALPARVGRLWVTGVIAPMTPNGA